MQCIPQNHKILMGKTWENDGCPLDLWVLYLILREIHSCLRFLVFEYIKIQTEPGYPDAEFAIDSQSKSSQQYTEVAGGDNMELQ
jgi:hypothetical protein